MFDLKTKVLIVDDMTSMRKIVMKCCKEIGFSDFTEASDGAQAWTAITNASPPFGLVLSDCNMPNSTGIDLLKRIRADSRFKTLCLVLITAASEKEQVLEAVQCGVSAFIIRPFATENLKQKLEEACKKHGS